MDIFEQAAAIHPFEQPKRAAGRDKVAPVKLPRGWSFVIDSNEAQVNHLAYDLKPAVVRKIAGAGDYTIQDAEGRGFDDRVLLERKSLEDFLGVIPRKVKDGTSEALIARERWEAALDRLARVEFPCVVLEADFDRLWRGKWEHSKVHANSVIGSMIAWSLDRRIPVWLAGTRPNGQMFAAWWLTKAALRIREAEKTGDRGRAPVAE